jgi:hypothetical protein
MGGGGHTVGSYARSKRYGGYSKSNHDSSVLVSTKRRPKYNNTSVVLVTVECGRI